LRSVSTHESSTEEFSKAQEPPLITECSAALAILAIAVCGDASAAETGEAIPPKLSVQYSLVFPDRSRLKEMPTEVTIVRRATTTKNAAVQVGLNVLLFAVGGGVSLNGFGKDDLKGETIEDAVDRQNLSNAVSTAFVERMQLAINDAIKASPESVSAMSNPLLVAGGNARLIYENLGGSDQEEFRLKTDMLLYKKREGAGLFSVRPAIMVQCAEQSPKAVAQSQWAEDGYKAVKVELEAAWASCVQKVIADLPKLLEQ
jgi:hypothetical protein